MIQQTPGKKRKFIVGKEVLCRDSAKESWYSRKLEPKWKGPYQIVAVLQSGNLPNKETSSRMIYVKFSKSDWLLYTDDRHSFLTFAKFHCGLDIIRINSKKDLVFIIIHNHLGLTLFEKVNEI